MNPPTTTQLNGLKPSKGSQASSKPQCLDAGSSGAERGLKRYRVDPDQWIFLCSGRKCTGLKRSDFCMSDTNENRACVLFWD